MGELDELFQRTLYCILLGGGIKSVALPWTPLNLELCYGTFSMNSLVRTDILWHGSRLLIAHNANAYPSVTQASPPAPPPLPWRTDTCQILRITTFCGPAPPCPLRGIIIERFVLVCVGVSLRVKFICPCHACSFSLSLFELCSWPGNCGSSLRLRFFRAIRMTLFI